MRTPLLAGVLTLASLHATAQNVYTVCDVTEFCFCWDGTVPAPTFTFTACPDSMAQTISILFCSGQMESENVLRGYDGTSNTGAPIPSITGVIPQLAGVGGMSESSSLYFELDNNPSPFNCMAGNRPPWRFLVWPGVASPAPVPGDCTGTDPFCSLTSVTEHTGPEEAWINYTNGNLLLPPALAGSGTLALIDPQGRTVRSYALRGSEMLPVGGDLVPGAYVAVLTDGDRRRTGRVLVVEP